MIHSIAFPCYFSRCFRLRFAALIRFMRAAHSGQYLALLEPGVNSAPHTAHFSAFSRWNNAVSSSLSCGNTSARNLVVASCTSFALPQAAKLTRFTAPPLPTKSTGLCGVPIAGSRKWTGRRRIPPHRPARYSCRRHSYSTHAPASALCDTGGNP